MKSVLIAGSRKFHNEINELAKILKHNKIEVSTAGKWDKKTKDILKSEKKELLQAFKKINISNFVYIYAKDGYIGKTVAMEIAYAHAKNKKIIASEKLHELSAQALISKVIPPNKLVEYCKN